jgi:hypothetical protein
MDPLRMPPLEAILCLLSCAPAMWFRPEVVVSALVVTYSKRGKWFPWKQ